MMKTLTLFFLLLAATLGAAISPLPSRHAITAGSLDLVLAANPANIETNVIVTTSPPMLLQWLAGDVTPADNTNYFASLTTNIGTWKVLGVLMPSGTTGATNSVINNFFTTILTNINQITQITYGNTNVLVITVPNVAALKALPTGIGIGSVFVRGTATPGDGGARWAVWYPGDGRQDNNGTIIRPNNELDNHGAFICDIDLYTGLHAIVFGAPVTNFVLQAAFDYTATVGYPNVILPTGSTLLDNTSPIDIPSGQLLTFENNAIVTFTDNTKTGFRFNGVTNAGIVGGAIQGANVGILLVGATNITITGVTATNNTTADIQFSLNGANQNDAIDWQKNNFANIAEASGSLARNIRFDFDRFRFRGLEISSSATQDRIARQNPPSTTYGGGQILWTATQSVMSSSVVSNGVTLRSASIFSDMNFPPYLALNEQSLDQPRTNTVFIFGGIATGNGDPNGRVAGYPGFLWERRDATNASGIPSLYVVAYQTNLGSSLLSRTNWVPIGIYGAPGDSTQVTFNSNGLYSAKSTFTFNPTNDTLQINGVYVSQAGRLGFGSNPSPTTINLSSGAIAYGALHQNITADNQNVDPSAGGGYSNVELDSDNATPSNRTIHLHSSLVHGQPLTIQVLSGGVQVLNNDTLTDTAGTIQLNTSLGDWNGVVGSTITLISDGTHWNETGRSIH